MSWGSGISGGGFFTDAVGLNAGKGKGAVAPTAGGANALSQGNACAASGDNSLAQGSGCTALARCFAQGEGCYSSGAGSANNFVQGSNCFTLTSSVDSFCQGRNAQIGYGATVIAGFSQGRDTYSVSSYTFAQGNLAVVRSPASLAQGDTVTINAGSAPTIGGNFAQGDTVSIGGGNFGGNFAQGDGVTLGSTPWASFAQGQDVTANGYAAFAQGYNVTVTAALAAPYGGAFGQGFEVTLSGQRLMAQGLELTLNDSYDCFAQGSYIQPTVAQTRSLFQGVDFTFGATTSITNGLVQGYSHVLGNGAIDNCLVQGEAHSISAGFERIFAQGEGCTVSNNNAFAQGNTCTVSGSSSFAQGTGCTASGASASFAQGASCTASNENAFAQGSSCVASGYASWAIGIVAQATRSFQRTRSSDRALAGAAQASTLTRYLATTDAVQTTLITFDLEQDKAYSIRINLVVRNTTTDSECASFALLQSIAYRNAGGAAVLQGSPVALTRVDTGGGSVNLLADLAQSGNNLLLRVTGETGETYNWCADFEFVEVAG